MPATTLRQASERYGGFYVPRFEIKSGGSGVDPAVLRDVLQVTYSDSISEIDSFDMTLNNWDPNTLELKYVGAEETVEGSTPRQRLFNPGAAEFELKFGYGDDLQPVVRGSTTSLEPAFPSGGASTLTVRALNVLHRLRTKQHRDHWPNDRVARGQVKISRIAEDIGSRRIEGCRFPLRIRIDEQAKAREPVLEYVAQDNQYDIDFLFLEARKIGYVVYVDQESAGRNRTRDVLHFGPSEARHPGVPAAAYELEWGKSLIDFTPKLSTANQLNAVEVRSHDRENNHDIRERVTLDDVDINRDLRDIVRGSGPRASDACAQREQVITNEPMHTTGQARRRAMAVLSDRMKQLVEATGTTVGLPDLRAGQNMLIVGLGARFSGRYFITKTTHTLDSSGYRTKFTARREAPLDGARPPRRPA
jgi:Bacteriophage probable baseplate hub protein